MNAVDIQKFLGGLNFPVDKNTIIQKAKQNGASAEVVDMLNKIPSRTYQKIGDIVHEIEKMSDTGEEADDEE